MLSTSSGEVESQMDELSNAIQAKEILEHVVSSLKQQLDDAMNIVGGKDFEISELQTVGKNTIYFRMFLTY